MMLQVEEIAGSTGNASARWVVIYDALKAAILQHNLVPGMKLPEDELCDVYSVSRTIVRAALQALAHDRLVQLEPNRGAFVAKPSKREAREVFEARALIEPKVAALAAEVAKPADIKLLRRHLDEEHRALHEGRQGDAVLLSARFHEAIATIAGQSILLEYVRGLCSRSALILLLYSRRQETFCDSHAHRALVDALKKNDTHSAAKLMTSHLADLLSAVDLSNREQEPQRSLADILKPPADGRG